MSTLLSSMWFPTHERASAVGISMAGFHLGNVTGLLLTPIMLSSMGFSGPFILFSSLGLLWLTIWTYTITNDLRESDFISKSELRLIQVGKSDSPVTTTENMILVCSEEERKKRDIHCDQTRRLAGSDLTPYDKRGSMFVLVRGDICLILSILYLEFDSSKFWLDQSLSTSQNMCKGSTVQSPSDYHI
ncbi:putative phosphate-transporting ATPase [Rosa chinensis]|uniref:Putative phosphate-transporting ATPase n=1 Tax=Rosa chinensis TaxID=74649 RepID=A0A2P6SE41_ROSCH|nr:putative phosphate-transporting ATPase [Rosa chinensis]